MLFQLLSSLVAVVAAAASSRSQVQDSLEGYVFAYFTGNTVEGENIYLAASKGNNVLNWTELNDGQPILRSSLGTKGLRDPFLMRSHDGSTFYLLATDLSIGSGTSWDAAVRTGSRYLEIWESADLVNWSEQRHVLVSPPTAGNTWAPEAYYDTELETYVVFWASSLYATNDTDHSGVSRPVMLYATTADFVSFSEPVVWQDAGASRIDSTVIKEGSTYYRFTKDEGHGVSDCSDIIQECATNLTATLEGWTILDTCIGQRAGLDAVEGPTVLKSNPDDVNGERYLLFVDEYGGRGYVPLETTDIAQPDWQVAANYSLPTSPRHGTVLPVTATELALLTGKETANCTQVGKPTIPGLYADPNLAVFGHNYYLYATTDGVPGWGGNQFFVWTSKDIVHWERSKDPILTLNGTDGNVPWATGNAWAPTIIERRGKYYFYFSGQNPDFDRKTIGVAVAHSPRGPFIAQESPMITNGESVSTGQAIDPAVFRDPRSGKYYLYWGNGSPLYAELSSNMTSIEANTIKPISGLTDFREGIFVVYRRPYYHLMYSIDDTGSENYRVGYATSKSADGPWTSRGIILQKDPAHCIFATGHNSLINVPGTDDWYIAYHRFAMPNGDGTHREVVIDRVFFDRRTGLLKPVVPTANGVLQREYIHQ